MDNLTGLRKNRVAVFGIFDGVHDGHRFLFLQARDRGEELIAVVGRDSYVREFKHKEPKHSQEERLRMVREEPLVDRAVLSDVTPSTYGVIRELRPDIICLGYDQDALEKDLRAWMEKNGVEIPVAQALRRH